MERSILAIIYESYPFAMDTDKIFELIEERGLLEMSEEEFDVYTNTIMQAKYN
jgi:hypothetical protein